MKIRLLSTVVILASLFIYACGTKIQEDNMKPIANDDFIQALLAPKPLQDTSDSMKLFGQFLGSWEWAGYDYADDGSKTPTRGRWIFESVLNGMAIQDVFIFENPHRDQKQAAYAEYGTTLRFPNRDGESWKAVWVGPMNKVARILEAKAVGDEIVLEGKNESDQPIRWIFSNIMESSFHWRGEYSADHGRSWVLYEDLEAKRIIQKMNESTSPSSSSDAGLVRGQSCCPVVELRQYTLHPGKRDVLIDLFDREFIESQEAVGMRIIGQFRDLDHPNRFVWLRGFRDMPSRAQALKDFYGGPVWKAHREAANATMIDSDNVLLLRPARAESGFSFEKSNRPPLGADIVPTGLVVAIIYYFDAPVSEDFVAFFDQVMKPVLIDAGASILAYFVTESSVNSFLALPVREGENVFVWFSSFRDQAAYENYTAGLARSPQWGGEISKELARRLKGHPEVLCLSPTARSLLHD
jgi:hypothetical protein